MCRIHIDANVMVNRDFRVCQKWVKIGNCDTSRMKLQADRRRLRCNVLDQRPLSMIMLLDEVNIVGSRRAALNRIHRPTDADAGLFSHTISALCSHCIASHLKVCALFVAPSLGTDGMRSSFPSAWHNRAHPRSCHGVPSPPCTYWWLGQSKEDSQVRRCEAAPQSQ